MNATRRALGDNHVFQSPPPTPKQYNTFASKNQLGDDDEAKSLWVCDFHNPGGMRFASKKRTRQRQTRNEPRRVLQGL